MSDSITKLYYGKNIDVTFDPKRCIHAAECVNKLARVFDTSRRPWILTDNSEADEVARVVELCPSGALHFIRKDGGGVEQPPEKSRVIVEADGPLYIQGRVIIQSEDGKVQIEDTRVALCRCGESLNKPFCDNSHLAVMYQDACKFSNVIIPDSAQSGEGEADCLKITFKETGSYHLDGQFEIIGPNGDRLFEGTHASVCRCGKSLNQPFCDRSHRNIV